MKKYFYTLFIGMLAAGMFQSCTDEEGTVPGGDAQPVITVFEYDTKAPNDPDNDATYRLAINSKTTEAYYLAEATADKDARNMSEADYASYVVANGTKLNFTETSFDGSKELDLVVSDMKGAYTVSFVAVNGNDKTLVTKDFFGLEWIDVYQGTYYFSTRAQQRLGVGASTTTKLQYCKTEPSLYRFKDLYGAANSLKLRMTDKTGADNYDELTYMRVEPQATPFEYGDYGIINVRDLGYWQNDDSFAYDPGYGCYIYTDKYAGVVTVAIQYYVSAGSLGYGWDEFDPE